MSNLLPYRDIYFPYGILFYLKNQNIFMHVIYLFVAPILFLIVFIFLKKIFKDLFFYLISFLTFFIFIHKFTGIENFNRYGIILAISLLISYIFYKKNYVPVKISFLLGIIIGVIFSLVNDQGIYSLITFKFFLFAAPIVGFGLKELKKLTYYRFIFSRLFTFYIGLFLGFIPFVSYLISKNIILDLISYLVKFSDFQIYAKTPFIPFSTTIDNLFTFTALFLAIVLSCYKLFYSSKKLSLSFFTTLGLIFIIVLLEQKSLIRSIDKQITFISFTLFLLIFYEFYILMKIKFERLAALFTYLLVLFFILYMIRLNPFINYKFEFKKEFVNKILSGNLDNLLLYKNKVCLKDNLNKLLTNKNKSFEKVIEYINNDSNEDKKIFAYLSDPIFYPLFNQAPPYYFTIFEASPLYAQKDNIKYIENNNIDYIIYNTNILGLQDNVPDYARQKILFKYIINNFTIVKDIDNFFVLKKTKNEDFFENGYLRKLDFFQDYLLQINLAAIPKSEGMHKGESLYKSKRNIIISSSSFSGLNNFLDSNIVRSSEAVLILRPMNYKGGDEKKMSVTLKTRDSKVTTVSFYRCDIGKICIINISNIPLFYRERVLKEVIPDNSFEGEMRLFQVTSEDYGLW